MNEPGNFSFIANQHERTMLADAYQAITAAELWGWMCDAEPPDGLGYMFWRAPEIQRIAEKMQLYDGHSGSSFGFVMRHMQYIAKNGWDDYVSLYKADRAPSPPSPPSPPPPPAPPIPPPACRCRAARGFTTGWCGVAGGGVPGCEH